MKKTILLIALVLIVSSNLILAQVHGITCDFVPSSGSSIRAVTGGMFKPAKNLPGEYLRALIVFAQFGDKNTDVSNWHPFQLSQLGKLTNRQ